ANPSPPAARSFRGAGAHGFLVRARDFFPSLSLRKKVRRFLYAASRGPAVRHSRRDKPRLVFQKAGAVPATATYARAPSTRVPTRSTFLSAGCSCRAARRRLPRESAIAELSPLQTRSRCL